MWNCGDSKFYRRDDNPAFGGLFCNNRRVRVAKATSPPKSGFFVQEWYKMSDENNQTVGQRGLPIQIDRAMIERDAKAIGPYGIAVYAVLCLYENLPEITPSQATIAMTLGISRNTIKAALAALEKAGWLAIEQRFNEVTHQYDSNKYTLIASPYQLGGVGHQVTKGWSPDEQESTTTTDSANAPIRMWKRNIGIITP